MLPAEATPQSNLAGVSRWQIQVNLRAYLNKGMKLMMGISPWDLGQISGAVSQTFRIKSDQRFFNSLETGGAGTSVTSVGSISSVVIKSHGFHFSYLTDFSNQSIMT